MFKDLPASLVAAVSQINQKSREAYVAEQKAIEVKKDIKAKHSSMMPKQPEPKADPAAVSAAKKMAEEKEGTVPKTPREKELAAKAGNKKVITHADVMVARGVKMKEEAEQADEEHIGFKKLAAKTSPALAAWIGREKYGKKKFQAMAERGKKQQAEEVEAVEGDLTEMDKSEPSGGRDAGYLPGPDKKATPISKEKMIKNAVAALNKPMNKEYGKKEVKEEDVAEGLMDTMKKIGKKVVDTVGHKDDKDLLDDLRKKMNPEPSVSAPTAKAKLKSPMAHDYVKEDKEKGEKKETAAQEKAEKKKTMKMESWDAMMKKVKADSEKEKNEKGTGKFDTKKTSTGTVYTRKSNTFVNGTEDKAKTKNEEAGQVNEFHYDPGMGGLAAPIIGAIAGGKAVQHAHSWIKDKLAARKAKKDSSSIKKEEVEVLDELSKSTLGSYAKKASSDAVITRKIGADFENRANRAKSPAMKGVNTELSSKYKQMSWKRRDGLNKAVDRLTKEEVEVIDEATAVHPKAIHVSDAGGGKYKVHAVGKEFAHGIKVGEHLTDTHLDDFSEMGGKVKMVKPPKKD